MTAVIRRATPLDAPDLAHLAALTFPLACPPGTTDEDIAAFIAGNLTAAHFAQHISQPDTRVIVAQDAPLIHDDSRTPSTTPGRLRGYVLLIGGQLGAPAPEFGVRAARSAYLSKFYVHSSDHGGSVSRPLLAAACEAGRELGAGSLWLAVNQLNARAIRFYEKSGFERVGVKTMQVGAELHSDFVYEFAL